MTRDRRVRDPLEETSAKLPMADLECFLSTAGDCRDHPKPTTIDHVIVREGIRQGERVREFVVEGLTGGGRKRHCKTRSIGHKRIDRFVSVEVSEVRLRITKSIAPPIIRRLAVFNVAGGSQPPVRIP